MRQNRSGFTLVEIMIALALLGLVIVMILTPMLGLFGFNRNTGDILDANTVVSQRLDEARTLVRSNYATPINFKARLDDLGITCQNIGIYGAVLNNSCYDTSASTPPLRRLTISTTQGNQSVSASVDVNQ